MIMTEKEFKSTIEAGQTIRYGCLTFYKLMDIYYYSHPKKTYNNAGLQVFSTFEKFWAEVSHWLLFGIDYNGSREGPPALIFNINQFNNMAKHNPCAVILGEEE